MLDIEVKLPLALHKPQSLGGESSEQTSDSPRTTSEDRTTESTEPLEESSLATTTSEDLGSDDGPAAAALHALEARPSVGAASGVVEDAAVVREEEAEGGEQMNDTPPSVYNVKICPAAEPEGAVHLPLQVLRPLQPLQPSPPLHPIPSQHNEEQVERVQTEVTQGNVATTTLTPEQCAATYACANSVGGVTDHEVGNSAAAVAAAATVAAAAARPEAAQAAASQTTEPFSWYQAQYQYPQYSQYQQYQQQQQQQQSSSQNYHNYPEYPQYSPYHQYSQYSQYQQYPHYHPQHHPQDSSYWASSSRAPSPRKVEPLSAAKIDDLYSNLMRLKDEVLASREAIARLERLEHKVEFIMDYLKHKLVQNDVRATASRDDSSIEIKERLIKMESAMNEIEQHFSATYSGDEIAESKGNPPAYTRREPPPE